MSDEAATKEFDAGIKEIGDKLAELSLKQAVDLGDYLKEAYGIEAAAGGGVVMAAAGGDAGGAAEEEKTEFNVVLKAAGDQKIKVIKIVREATGLGLKEAKELVDAGGKAVKENLPKEDADKLAEQLKEVGAEVELT
ncbi:MAG: 50S ribosomal protein L7/L12 [Planctomycetota bacterium]